MKIIKLNSNCGGYGKPKGHLDTQMFPECEGHPGDRDVVKKTRERRKKNKKKKKSSLDFPIVEAKKKRPGDPRGGVLEAMAPHKCPRLSPDFRTWEMWT